MDFLEIVVFDNPLVGWGVALLIFVLVILVLRLARRWFLSRMARLVVRTETDLDDLLAYLLGETKPVFILILAAYVASLALTLSDGIKVGVRVVAIIALLIQVAFWGMGVINHLIQRKVQQQLKEDAAEATDLSVLGLVAKIVLWSVVVLLILDNIPGVEVNSLIASLGIGGIAVALAVQNILGDLFASVSIALDKPFVIGDQINVDGFTGSVEHIGLKSTRVRSVSGEQLIFSNADLLSSRIRNYKRMKRRRVEFTIGVTYQTPYSRLVAIPDIIQEIIEAHDNVSFDRAHLREYGDFSINFEIVYFVETPDYQAYMDVQQDINLALFKRFEDEGIEFAYPTQTIFVAK